MSEREISANELARQTGVPQPTISRIVKGESKDPDTATLQPIAAWFGRTVAELRGESVPDSTLTESRTGYSPFPQGATIARIVPLIPWGKVATWRDAVKHVTPDSEQYPCPIDCGPETFALRVEGISMEPRFRAGEIVFVDPQAEPRDDCFVIAQADSDPVPKLKRYLVEGGKAYLHSLNPQWPEPIAAVDSSVILVGVVIFKGERL